MTMPSTRGCSVDMSEYDLESVASDNGEESFTASVSEEIIKPVASFSYFPKLPAEIRLKIWKNALPGPRIIRMELKYGARVPVKAGEKRKPKIAHFVGSRSRPVGLQVCRESRIEALKEYELAFPTKTSPAQTYINFAMDTMVLDKIPSYFPHTTSTTLVHETTSNSKKKPVILHREFSKLRFIVIEEQFLWNPRLLTSNNFPSLVTINIIRYNKLGPYYVPAFHDLEECEGPEDSQSNPYLAQAVGKWLSGMQALAKNADVNRPPPGIRFVRPFRGLLRVARDEVKVKGVDVNEVAKEDGIELLGGSAQHCLKMDGTLEI
jgi:hypothetical protein